MEQISSREIVAVGARARRPHPPFPHFHFALIHKSRLWHVNSHASHPLTYLLIELAQLRDCVNGQPDFQSKGERSSPSTQRLRATVPPMALYELLTVRAEN